MKEFGGKWVENRKKFVKGRLKTVEKLVDGSKMCEIWTNCCERIESDRKLISDE